VAFTDILDFPLTIQGNNLLQLTETLQSIFSREPPLYAKPAQPPATNGQSLSVQSSYSPGSSQPRPPHQGPRPPPAPPIAASSSHQSPGPASSSSSSYTNRQSSMSPSQLQPQINPSSSQGPPLRPQKKTWLNGQASPAGPPAGQYVNDHHHRSASTSSIQQAQVAPQGYVTPYNGAQQHPQQQQQQPPRPPHPQALEHSRSPSMGLPMRQPSLHVQASSLQPPFSPQQSSQGQYRPQQQQQQHYQLSPGSAAGPSFQPSPASPPPFSGQPKNITAQQHQATSHFSASSMNPQASQAPFQVQHYHHQSQSQRQPFASSSHANQPVPANPPAPYIPPRPDGLRQGTSSPAGTVAPRVLSTPINILDEDNEPSAASTSASTTQAPPPRPTNPALLSLRRALYTQLLHHLHTLQAHLNNENTHLNALHEDLLKGEPAITDEMQRLEAVRDVCLSVRDRMQEVVSSAERNIHDLSTRPETEVDELICGTNVVHNQYAYPVASGCFCDKLD
jgi:ESCRT-I complex subunit TSG101